MNSLRINTCTPNILNKSNNDTISFKSNCKLPYGNVMATLCKTNDDIIGMVLFPLHEIPEKTINPTFIDKRKCIFEYWKNDNKVLLHIVKFVENFVENGLKLHNKNEIAGTAVISPLNRTFYQCKSNDIAYLSDLYLHPSVRSHGNGKAFIEHLKEDAKKIGYKKILLNVEKDNKIAHKLYLKTGFRVIDDNKMINEIKLESEYFNRNDFMVVDL